jgi:hypothetical protein
VKEEARARESKVDEKFFQIKNANWSGLEGRFAIK